MGNANITDDDFVAAVREVVAEAGEGYVYEAPDGIGGRCVYADKDGNPSCLIGRVIAKLDVSLLPDVFCDDPAVRLLSRIFPGFSSNVCRWAKDMQVNQDGGQAWGSAIRNTYHQPGNLEGLHVNA